MEKAQKYADLVAKRKKCSLCGANIHNGYKIAQDNNLHETENIGPWYEFAGINGIEALDAKIIILGQDWFPDHVYKKELEKYGQEKYQPDVEDCPTNRKLSEMVKKIDTNIDIMVKKDIKDKKEANYKLFATNLLLCYKEGKANATIPQACYDNCRGCFFNALVDIIQPEFIITLGKSVFQALTRDKRFNASPNYKFVYYNNVINAGLNGVCKYQYEINSKDSAIILPVAHTGSFGQKNRNFCSDKLFYKTKDEWEQAIKADFPQENDKMQVDRDWEKIGNIAKRQSRY